MINKTLTMMKKLVYIVCALVTLSACDDWLEIVPKGKIIPTKTEDYRLLLDQRVSRGASNGFEESYGNMLFMSDDVIMSDDNFDENMGENDRNAYTWKDHIYLSTESDGDWQALYSQISVANVVIDEIYDAEGDVTEKNQLYAEAKVQRAYCYLILVNLYSKHYNSSSASTDLGIPMLFEPVLEGSLKRSSVQDAYNLILNDVQEVVDFLPDVNDFNLRPSKAAAYALLSRAYLLIGDYTNALINSEESLKYKSFVYDYNELPKNRWYATVVDLPDGYENEEVLLLKTASNPYKLIYPSPELESLYDKTNDLRYTGLYYDEWFPPYESKLYITEYLSGRQYGLSTTEMLLTRAECNARNGEINKAMEDLDFLGEKRYETGTYTPVSAANKEEALLLVKEERRRELAFKGVRWFDLKRYNENDDANISITRTVKGTPYTLAPGDNKWVLPIGELYRSKNSEIEQNPR